MVVLQHCLNFTYYVHKEVSLVYFSKINESLWQAMPFLQSQKDYIKRKAYTCIQEIAGPNNGYLQYLKICWSEATIAMHKLKVLVSMQEKLTF